MTNKQRILILALLVVLAATLLYPPMHVVSLYGDRSLGRNWIFDREYDVATIDFGELFIEWIFFGIIISAFYIARPLLEKYKQGMYLIAITTTRIIRILLAFSILIVGLGIPFSFLAKELIGNESEADIGKWLALLLIRVFLLIVLISIFFGLRRLINFFHIEVYGIPHPKIIKKWDI